LVSTSAAEASATDAAAMRQPLDDSVCTDTSAKPVKDCLAKVVGQSGDISSRVMRRRADRELAALVASGKKIPFPAPGARR
jgi:hypothetical protein